MDIHFCHLRDGPSSHPLRLLKLLKQKTNLPGVRNWGIFPGLFGLGTNEAYWVYQTDPGMTDGSVFSPNDELEVIEANRFSATVRPVEFVECAKSGIYVFRWFEVSDDRIAEVVRLSNEAWTSFEGGFDTEIQGLFTVDGQGRYRMVLVTWYRDLSVWQASREPAPEAKQNFVARQALLTSARPIATRLEIL